MICSNCGTTNMGGSKFCIRCGQPVGMTQGGIPSGVPQGIQTGVNPNTIQEVNSSVAGISQPTLNQGNATAFSQSGVNPALSFMSQENTNMQAVSSQNGPVQEFVTPIPEQKVVRESALTKISIGNYFFLILAVMIKPWTSFKEESAKFNEIKHSILLSLLVSVIATILAVVKTMLSVVIVKSFSWSSGGVKTSWEWENLKELNYLQLIGKNFLIYIGIIGVLAGLYYLGSLIIKKQVSFSRFLGISALSAAPAFVSILLLSPLLSLLYVPLGMIVSVLGSVYTVVLFYEVLNQELQLDGNKKIYFNLICLSIFIIALYYLWTKVAFGDLSNSANDIFHLF